MKYRFGRALEKKLGIKVFGPRVSSAAHAFMGVHNDCGRPCRRSPNSTKRLMSASGIASARLHHRLDTRPFGVRSLTAFWHSTAGTHGSVCRLVKDRYRYAWRRQARARNRAPGGRNCVRTSGPRISLARGRNSKRSFDQRSRCRSRWGLYCLVSHTRNLPRAVLSLPQQRRNR